MSSLKAYLQLVRLPAVFTALADIVLGVTLVSSVRTQPVAFSCLLLSSACLYLSGMVFNDLFDRKIDQQERPERPIPSGRVPVLAALSLGGLLMVAGLAAAAVVGLNSLTIAGLLALCVLAYDGVFKPTPFGPLFMGGCRALNVLLGASLLEAAVWQPPQSWVALLLGIYVAGLTWFARNEATESRRGQLAAAMLVVDCGLLGCFWLVNQPELSAGASSLRLMFLLAVIGILVNRRLTAAIRSPEPRTIQAAVRLMLLSLVMLDATLIYGASGDVLVTLAAIALLLPPIVIGRWLYMT